MSVVSDFVVPIFTFLDGVMSRHKTLSQSIPALFGSTDTDPALIMPAYERVRTVTLCFAEGNLGQVSRWCSPHKPHLP
jgi:hypothetical protein